MPPARSKRPAACPDANIAAGAHGTRQLSSRVPCCCSPVTRAAAAPAELAATSARLEVQALPDCTTREELAARVAARSRRIHFDDDGPPDRPSARSSPARPRGGAVGRAGDRPARRQELVAPPVGRVVRRGDRRHRAHHRAHARPDVGVGEAIRVARPSAAAGRPGPTAPAASAPPTGPTPPPPAANEPARTPPEAAPARPPAPARSAENPTRPEREAPPAPSADREPPGRRFPPGAAGRHAASLRWRRHRAGDLRPGARTRSLASAST